MGHFLLFFKHHQLLIIQRLAVIKFMITLINANHHHRTTQKLSQEAKV